MNGKLTILLVDDAPTYLKDGKKLRLPRPLKPLFDIVWIQTVREARWFIEAVEAILSADTRLLETVGLPPDVIIFDYALTQPNGEMRPDDSNSVESRLRPCLEKYRIEVAHSSPDELETPPVASLPGYDRHGLYVGGALARLFAMHPCGALPTTAKVKEINIAQEDAAFQEWLNASFFQGAFAAKERGNPTIESLLSEALPLFRSRCVQLVRSGAVRLRLESLQKLAQGIRNSVEPVTATSRFGRFELPLRSLFADGSVCADTPDPFKTSDAAKEWAEDLLKASFDSTSASDFSEARDVAQEYWSAWVSEEAELRDQLSTIASDHENSTDESFEELCESVGVSPEVVKNDPKKARVRKEGFVKPVWKEACATDSVARWVALFLTVRAEKYYRHSAIRPLLTKEEQDLGEVELDDLTKRADVEGVDISEELGSFDRRRPHREGTVLRLPPLGRASPDTVYSLLDPLPKQLLLYTHRGTTRASGRPRKATTILQALKRMGGASDGWGRLGLSITDVLAGRHFDCAACKRALKTESKQPPAGEHKTKSGRTHHGVRRGEGRILRLYAEQIDFPEPLWPEWLANAP